MFGDSVEVIGRKSLAISRKGKDRGCQPARVGHAVAGIRGKLLPSENVFFRPEEIHLTSGEWVLAPPLRNRNVDVGNRACRVQVKEFAVLHPKRDRLAAVETS